MAYRYEVEVTVSFARDVKNVNWQYGPTRPYAVLWIDPNNKCSTRADDTGDTCPRWDQTLVLPIPPVPLDEATLYVDVVHAGSEEGTKRLIGSARLRLNDVIDDVGLRERSNCTLQLKRPSGRPQGKIELEVAVRQTAGYRAPDPYGYGAPQQYGGYAYGAAPQTGPYYGDGEGVVKKKSGMGMGMGAGLVIGAVGGALGAVALMEGADLVEDAFDDKVDDAVEEALEDDDDDY